MDRELFDALGIAIWGIFILLIIYSNSKQAAQIKNLKEENERLKYELLQSEIKNLHQQNDTLKQQNNFSTDTVE